MSTTEQPQNDLHTQEVVQYVLASQEHRKNTQAGQRSENVVFCGLPQELVILHVTTSN